MEEAIFLGDWSFFNHLSRLTNCQVPLIDGLGEVDFNRLQGKGEYQNFLNGKLNLTPLGNAVLTGKEDYLDRNIADFWWGGTHINKNNRWRWAPNDKRVLIA